MNLARYIRAQIHWSIATFGPGRRTKGLLQHMRKELIEVEADPTDVTEWIDLVILALDGAWRHGATATEICKALEAKQKKNIARKWPDWRKSTEDQAIEHDRTNENAISKIG